MFDSVLIANRGEIACRVIRTCRRLGIRTIAVYSEADKNAQHVRLADEAWPIGKAAPAESYLRGDVIIEVARKAGAQAIHPGYGFLSENTDFSRNCTQAGITFIGPKPESIDAMGSKAAAKAIMEHHEVPLVPGYHGDDQSEKTLVEEAEKTGFPLMIKAASGGGGKGMRIVHEKPDFVDELAAAKREAQGAFGDDRVILERYVEHPRHIEFQIFADTHGNAIHLNERECSSQRRFQKVMEETPSPFLTPERRRQMGKAAVAAAKAVDYVGAGTVEFIVGADGEFFFMEMNTRLQVEHPVTEMTLGLDLVEWQLRVADGEKLPLAQEAIKANGHAIEVRLYAEDPDQNFLPGSGKLEELKLPATSGHVRLDGGVIEGDMVTVFYDPMIAKLIVHDENRSKSLKRMQEALANCHISGPKSNIAFLERLITHPIIVNAEIDTSYLDRNLHEFVNTDVEPDMHVLTSAACLALLHEEATTMPARNDPYSPWDQADAWRIGQAGKRVIMLHQGENLLEISATGYQGNYLVSHNDQQVQVEGAQFEQGILQARFDGVSKRHHAHYAANRITVHDQQGERHRFEKLTLDTWENDDSSGGDQILAPMPGHVIMVKANAGDTVKHDQDIVIIEAMKMELALKAPRDGVIEEITINEGDFVDADSVLVRFVVA